MANKKKYDWDALEAEFIRANISLKEFAKRKEISYRYLGNKASAGCWHDKRDELQSKVREEVKADIVAAAEKNSAGALVASTPEAVIARSKAVGDKLYTLLQAAVAATEQGDTRELRGAIEAWSKLDDQVRKIHKLDDAKERPLVNIQVMNALPSANRVVEAKGVVVES